MKKGGLGSRITVALWGIPLILGSTWLGGWYLATLIGVISVIALHEYYKLLSGMGKSSFHWAGIITAVIIVLTWEIGIQHTAWVLMAAFMIFAAFALLQNRSHQDIVTTLSGLIYIPLLYGSFIYIRAWSSDELVINEGQWLALAVWCALWICDTFAYAGGRLLGKNKLAPIVSPNKSVEGFLFGLFGAILFCLIWWRLGKVSLDIAIVTGISTGLFGQIGDLFESSLKRECQVKDSSNLLAGHGGILDRFDSFLISAPMIAMYLYIRSDILDFLR